MSLNVCASIASSAEPPRGTGSGETPSARLRLASATRRTGPAIQREMTSEPNAASAAPIAPAISSARRNGPQPAAFRLAGRRSTKPLPGRLSILDAPATR